MFILLLSSAFATTIPVMGVLVNINPDDSCKAEILGVVPPAKAAAITEGVLSAQADCFAKKSEAQADVITAKAHATSEYLLAKATAKAVETGDGGNLRFQSGGDLKVEIGEHLNYEAYAGSIYGNGLAPGMPLASTNPEAAMLWRLASTEAAFAASPQIPAGVVVPPPATSKEELKKDDELKKELEEARAQLEAKTKLLKERDAELAEKQGS